MGGGMEDTAKIYGREQEEKQYELHELVKKIGFAYLDLQYLTKEAMELEEELED